MASNVVYDTGSTWLTVKSAMCENCQNASKVYDPANSTVSSTEYLGFGQRYGSADLTGTLYNDTVCLNNITKDSNVSSSLSERAESDICVDNFRFIAITKSTGLSPAIHGILGLTPE